MRRFSYLGTPPSNATAKLVWFGKIQPEAAAHWSPLSNHGDGK